VINLPNIKGLVTLGKTVVLAHRPELLFGASITATLGAVVLAGKGGYEARGIVDEAQAKSVEPLTAKQKANLTWHCYMPSAVMTIGALGSTTGLHIVHVKEKKALAQTALGIIEEVKESAKEFERENLGVLTKEEKDKVLEERADENGVAHIQNTDGEIEELYLVRDPISGRDIWSNKARIEEAIVEIGNMINGSDSASLNNFYDNAGWGRLDSAELVGWSGAFPMIMWNDENGMPISGVRDDGRPWRGFRFSPQPQKGFDEYR
jgi:hypothetical protein